MNSNEQFGRVANLVVANTTLGMGRDLSQMHFRFQVRQADNETPNTLVVRIYNLSPQTENEIIAQYDQVALQAGYVGAGPQVVFTGQIKMFRKGKETSTDKFLEISAADADLGYNFGFVNKTFSPGATQLDVINECAKQMGLSVDPQAASYASTGGIYPRGKVLFGLARAHVRIVADSLGCRWSISDTGALTFIKNTGYLDSEAVVLNSTTGLVGVPESTPDGINIRCLMNPKIKIGCLVQIDSSAIVTSSTTQAQRQLLNGGDGINFPSYGAIIFPATVQRGIGTYRVIVSEQDGDTREQDWYSDLVCLSVDISSPRDSSVSATGIAAK